MSADKSPSIEATPQATPMTEPRSVGYGHPEYHFVQAVMELRTAMHQMDTDNKVTMARLESKLEGLKDSTDSTKKKVEDLVRWKTLILGGAVVLGVVITGAFSLYAKFGDRISLAPMPATPAPATPAPAAPAPAAPAK